MLKIKALEKINNIKFLVDLRSADKENRVLVTNDKDFGELIFRLKKPSCGAILLRLKRDNPKNRQKYIWPLILNFPQRLHGNFIQSN